MQKRNIWSNADWKQVGPNAWRNEGLQLELHTDDRGDIVDIFYNTNINHVNMIRSNKGALRGNHYHVKSTQHMLMINGSMEYWYKPLNSNEPAKCELQKNWEIISTPPNEIHALKILEPETVFITFASGLRGGKDYESDTIRVSPSIIQETK